MPIEDNTKPPLGLEPRSIHERSRRIEILAAMARYTADSKLIPEEWIKELTDLNK